MTPNIRQTEEFQRAVLHADARSIRGWRGSLGSSLRRGVAPRGLQDMHTSKLKLKPINTRALVSAALPSAAVLVHLGAAEGSDAVHRLWKQLTRSAWPPAEQRCALLGFAGASLTAGR